ncbi:unnamed protein product [Brassica rapa subsp. narinosa]|uniref:(rape) hypothetical protein n=1 Tax=Brassica napus TaxID=3708 RepID=A0A816W8I9_BRANA|nr:unnamed protein product [Brassica napus]
MSKWGFCWKSSNRPKPLIMASHQKYICFSFIPH